MRPLPFSVFNSARELVGKLAFAEDAAALVSALSEDGATIRWHNRIVWTEGEDGFAGESYDHVAEVIHLRIGE